ncbi:flocculation protein FLO11 [Mugil cephalus]|uniref:flocculation protein FLO11 n=1 Tax=Mugil cephalus TaxID=48193 RepID=UPI001FB77A7B|nr:flocculation protein FLO11 [Mugil cephalus]
METDMEKGHMSVRRGVSWSPGELRKPLQLTEDMHTPGTDCDASWEKTGFNKEHMSRKTNLTRSASLSEKELKEARVRSQIIAAQLTIPSNSSSRGVQLFNRRKQRVNAFTLKSSGEGSEEDKAENVKTDSNKLTWAERSSKEKDRDLNLKNRATKSVFSPSGRVHSVGDIMDEPGEDFHKKDDMEDSIIQERHFLPVKEEQEEEEEEEARDEIHEGLEGNVKHEIPPGSNNTDPIVTGREAEAGINGGHTGPVPAGKLHNGCHSASGPERVSSPTSSQARTIINRTARPFFSPPTVNPPVALSPVMDVPPPPSYSTPPLPVCNAPQPVVFSPPPPPPSYPTPPLPAFTNQPPQTCHSSPPPMSPVMSMSSPPPSNFPVAQYPPMPNYGPPTAPKPTAFVPQPTTFVPQPTREGKLIAPVKTGILEESAAKRANKKSMFTFKEKPVVAPNPELLSLVQGVDERKKHGHRSVPEPAPEEELMALGAEASNFLAKEADKADGAKAPEWASCLKSSRTQPRAEHRPEQTLTNVSGKGAELFAKRQSRMEKYVVENQNAGQIRSPSPTMSLPPSWVYPSNMPGRVKAIAKNSDMSAQLSQNLKAQQAVKQKPRPKVAAPEPAPEPSPLENGCSKIEMDLSRHRPYQLNSSLFIFNPVKDPVSTLPRRAPQASNLITTQTFSRQTSLPNNPPSPFTTQCMSPQLPLSPTGGPEYPPNPALGSQRISSPMSAFSPERVSSPRSGAQAPRPTFSAKKAGIAPQTSKESSTNEIPCETPTPTRTTSLTRRFSTPEGPTTGTWTSSRQTNNPSPTISSSIRSVTSPVSSPSSTRCQSPMASQNIKFSTVSSTSTLRPSQTSTATSSCSPWGSRSQSPMVSQPSTTSSISAFRPSQTSATPPWGARCQSPGANQNNKSPFAVSFSSPRPPQTTATSPRSPPWGSRCQSPVVSQSTPASTISPGPTSRQSQTSTATFPHSSWGSRCQSPLVTNISQSSGVSISATRPSQTSSATSPVSPSWGSRSQSPSSFQTSLSLPATKPLYTLSATSSPVLQPRDSRCMSPIVNTQDSKANHRLLAKNIINAAKRKNSPSPGALSGHSLPISPLGNSHHGYDCHKPPMSPFQSRALGAQSPTFTSPPPTPTQRICSPVRLYNTRSLTDSDASVESEDSGLRSPGLHSYNTCPRGWGGSLRVKRSTVSSDL